MLRPSPNYGTLWLHNDDDDELRQENAVWLCHTAAWPWRGHNCYDKASPRQADVKSILFLILHVCQSVTVFIKRKRFYTGEILAPDAITGDGTCEYKYCYIRRKRLLFVISETYNIL
jgi:hypothetical protein